MQIIKLQSISKNFKSKQALKKVNLDFDSQKINGLLGPNGSGKTTLFNIIAGFLPPDEGQIILDGEDLTFLSLSKRSKLGISYLPQEPSIFRDMSVYDNIFAIAELFHSKAEAKKVTENLISQFSLQGFQKTQGKLLSGGERRRTEIARALASNPKFLLLDEPFAGIDPIAIEEVKSTVALLKKMNIGIIITDHNVKEASLTLWSVIIIPIFIFLRRATVDFTSSIAMGSIPAKGSSNNRNLGLLAKARAISVLLLSPPDNNLPCVFWNPWRENWLIRFSVTFLASAFEWNNSAIAKILS